MFESYLIDRERGVNPPKGYEDAKDGSWFGSFKVENDKVWEERDQFTGFSVEGVFGMMPARRTLEAEMAALAKDLTAFLQHLNPRYISNQRPKL
jgi:hypothetical protein